MLKFVSISRDSVKRAKNLYYNYPTEFISEVKNENLPQLDQFFH
jgi:hypothetical protein